MSMIMILEDRYKEYGNFKMFVININLSTFIIFKIGPSVINSKSNTTSIFYIVFFKTIFKSIILSINILPTYKLIVWMFN